MKPEHEQSSPGHSSPFKGDSRGSSKGDVRGSSKGDTRGSSKGDARGATGAFEWQGADPLEFEILKNNAQENRRNMTTAESAFWSVAKGNGLGEKCRRQYIIGDYIADFFFRKSMLIVEIDGGYHLTEEQQQKDSERQDWLEHNGYRVLRFTNEQVLFDIDNVTKELKQHLRYEQQ